MKYSLFTKPGFIQIMRCGDGGDGPGGAGIGGWGKDTNEDGRTSISESIADMFDGGGAGKSDDTFGGALGGVSNAVGATPRGSDAAPTGIAGAVSGRDEQGNLTNTSAAIRGALMGGIPGMIAGVAANQATGGKGIMGVAKGVAGNLFSSDTRDSMSGKTDSGATRPRSRPAGLGQASESMRGEGDSLRVAPTVTTAPPAATGATVALPAMSDMSSAAAQGGFQPIPNPQYDPTNPMSQQFLSNPTYDQLLAYRSRIPGSVVSFAEGGEMVGGNEKTMISAAVSAVKGEMSEEQSAVVLGQFLANYGEDALRDLVDKVQSGEYDDTVERFANGEAGEVNGPGDGSGVDDKVPASLEGAQDVLLADGEFVLRKKTADALEKKYGGGFLDTVNKAEENAPRTMREYMGRN